MNYTKSKDNVVPMYVKKENLLDKITKESISKYIAGGVIALSSFFAGQCYTKMNDPRVNLPDTVIGAPKNAVLIDYSFLEDNTPEDGVVSQPKGQIVSIKINPSDLSKATILEGKNRLTLTVPVTYKINCAGMEDTTLCTDTRMCQMTFKTIEDKVKN